MYFQRKQLFTSSGSSSLLPDKRAASITVTFIVQEDDGQHHKHIQHFKSLLHKEQLPQEQHYMLIVLT